MLFESPAFDEMVEAFRRLPGVGRRTAERLAMHLLSAPPEEAAKFSESVVRARGRISLCSVCRNLTETDPCVICADERRDHSLVCVVERPGGAIAIEKGGSFRGVYHVLHGVINMLEGIGPDELHLDSFFRRVEEQGVREVIVATNLTAEGEATSMYIARQLTRMGVSVSRIAQGVPTGGGLEYADSLTLSHAIEGRVRIGD